MKNHPDIRYGVIMAIIKVNIQLSSTAILSPLSVIISAMYNQGIGPRENSKNITNIKTKATAST
jgi:hypothetical protein